ncbi:hypothetical protein H0W26_04195 [Candidatus Dependentiae bacterium]|nr:hypothetical protein [Candidatus Dependentiae bacterium]
MNKTLFLTIALLAQSTRGLEAMQKEISVCYVKLPLEIQHLLFSYFLLTARPSIYDLKQCLSLVSKHFCSLYNKAFEPILFSCINKTKSIKNVLEKLSSLAQREEFF